MAKDQTKPLSPKKLVEDERVLEAIQGIPDYKPQNTDVALTKLNSADDDVTTATTTHTQAEDALKTARDGMVTAHWARHNLLLTAKQQVVAQYGDDSEQAAAVGLKKKSERAKPSRKAAAQAAKKTV